MSLNNLEEYSDPILYDLENKSFEPDGPFYLALTQRIGGRSASSDAAFSD